MKSVIMHYLAMIGRITSHFGVVNSRRKPVQPAGF